MDSTKDSGAQLVLLGTQSGPIPGTRAGIATALVVDGAIYLVDAGSGLPRQFFSAGLEFSRVRGMFITHLHSDHVADYFNFFSLNWTNWDFHRQTVEVYGPGRADATGPDDSGTPGLPSTPDAPLVAPELPTPGITDLTRLSIAAHAYDLNQRLRSTRRVGGRALEFTGLDGRPMLRSHDITVPTDANVAVPCPPMAPISVYADDKVTVTATLVQHPPVFPAFAFRFETAYGSVVFSGDTAPCKNLAELAQGTDVLVNEVMAVDPAVARFAGTPLYESMARQFTDAHTPHRTRPAGPGVAEVPGVGALAQRVGARSLVLTHIYPGDGSVPDEEFQTAAAEEFAGSVVVGHDLMSLDLRRSTTTSSAR
ncbi:MBL fold metallo-hydrolase [Sciscionella marina]|uniref:MBL fold metallo-hydrolase n=1 Tax=Sciscionella marina TaxID=508770 RepID=UPI00059148CA|nr:MBL fold metallo-hydrolase [Sciscionella marina]